MATENRRERGWLLPVPQTHSPVITRRREQLAIMAEGDSPDPAFFNLEASGTVAGTFTGTGTQTSGTSTRVFPDTTTVLNYYKTNGRAINFNGIPTNNGNKTIDKSLLSPLSNPFGSNTNAMSVLMASDPNRVPLLHSATLRFV